MAKKRSSATADRAAFAARLTALRHTFGIVSGRPGLTMGDFAQLLGVEGETYRRYERGETEPSLRTLTEIRRLTGISLNALIAGEIDPQDKPPQAQEPEPPRHPGGPEFRPLARSRDAERRRSAQRGTELERVGE